MYRIEGRIIVNRYGSIPNNIFDFTNEDQIIDKWFSNIENNMSKRRLIIGCGDTDNFKDQIDKYDVFLCYPENEGTIAKFLDNINIHDISDKIFLLMDLYNQEHKALASVIFDGFFDVINLDTNVNFIDYKFICNILSNHGYYDISNQGFPYIITNDMCIRVNKLLDKSLEEEDPRNKEIYNMFSNESNIRIINPDLLEQINHKLLTLILALEYDYRGTKFYIHDLIHSLYMNVKSINHRDDFRILMRVYVFLLGNFFFDYNLVDERVKFKMLIDEKLTIKMFVD